MLLILEKHPKLSTNRFYSSQSIHVEYLSPAHHESLTGGNSNHLTLNFKTSFIISSEFENELIMTSKRCILSLTSVLKCFSKIKFLIAPKRYNAIPILRRTRKPAFYNPLGNTLFLASKSGDTEYYPYRCEGREGRLCQSVT